MRYLTLIISSFTFIIILGSTLSSERRDFTVQTNLSAYGFFKGDLRNLEPSASVHPYTLNTPLFSDYALKARFFKLPEGKKMVYRELDHFTFPEGSILIKNFYYPADFRSPEKDRRVLETRLLIKQASGWKALPYIWNEDQTDATLEVAGGTLDVAWKNEKGKKKTIRYSVPNVNECKGCHVKNQEIKPIGPTARQMNRELNFNGVNRNQLDYYQELGLIELPTTNAIPRASVWNDPSTGTLDQRARDYLDMNCAHCHNPKAPANTSGLFLNIHQSDQKAYGIFKTPVAAGRGSGGRMYDVVPGKPDESIFIYRMESTDPGVMMPELGRSMVHKEGVELVREWIKSLDEG